MRQILRKLNKQVVYGVVCLIWMTSCGDSTEVDDKSNLSVFSPKEVNRINFFLNNDQQPCYTVLHNGEIVIDTSALGFEFKNQKAMMGDFSIKNSKQTKVNEVWEMPWGEQEQVVNEYQELSIELEEISGAQRALNIYFRVYDDGVAFRYEFLKQEGVDTLVITDENSEFNMTGDHLCWWTPGCWDSYEYLINTCKLSEIDAKSKVKGDEYWKSVIKDNAVHTPFTMRASNGTHLSIHEANLTDYAGMTVKVDGQKLVTELVGSDRYNHKVIRALPFKTPWRMIQIGDKATDLLESRLVVNLNDPNKIGDVSWFKPMKYVGIWWEMHIGTATWDMESVEKGARHGATTENTKKYIDFAAKNGFGGVLVEGWNTGWNRWIGFPDREGIFDFVTPYADYDLEELANYGNERGVQIIMHNETSAATETYDQQLDTAYKLMKARGIHSVKTGYVGPILPEGEYHHGQYMVNHYRRVLEKGAENEVAINVHEPIKPTGIRRTYPNAISREGARGQEYNAWSSDGGNPTEHNVLLAYTRLLAGPMDFTPGVFDIELPTKPNNQINTTLAQQLALYIVLYSPIQMACDLPENYEGQPALQFIKDVGVDWKQSIALNGEVGDYVTIAREERKTGNWFIGGVTDENKRSVTIKFDFLEVGKKYNAIYYLDGEDAHFKTNPTSISIEDEIVDANTEKTLEMVEGGGFAISLIIEE